MDDLNSLSRLEELKSPPLPGPPGLNWVLLVTTVAGMLVLVLGSYTWLARPSPSLFASHRAAYRAAADGLHAALREHDSAGIPTVLAPYVPGCPPLVCEPSPKAVPCPEISPSTSVPAPPADSAVSAERSTPAVLEPAVPEPAASAKPRAAHGPSDTQLRQTATKACVDKLHGSLLELEVTVTPGPPGAPATVMLRQSRAHKDVKNAAVVVTCVGEAVANALKHIPTKARRFTIDLER